MERLRPVNYIRHVKVLTGKGVLGYHFDKHEGSGRFHGIVKGIRELSGDGRHASYDFALVEDGQTGQLYKVELTDVTFTDILSDEIIEEYLHQK